ncbi:thioredoxin-disulfide reductase [Oceanihabitans sediminis]|uniref:Thioredoxin reductase n=1 Tax=Oceanihabitans sediminis TaxID=1812012 RepID=A0A368P3W9_9FLAO|nr:thioredoxin-disulfide reductase [Oceanihabitans sediminis]MDX1277398.1 thioredoxin-disulfide reductase [Oceanihabitans sediminis]MDX1774195.1 thioredoxin-disulfide reductase [Oceanihabitans sediminis]RBP30796.1 thioredoxin reductase (NADPH) [Oceanihabitans sediminis]RCU56764.1 thioredoxin-disulfide reductase [Oceanihabitans sediminis]
MSEKIERVKCLIIGSGPAGYTAAIYAARANMNPVLYQGMQPGGQLTTTNEVENFPGYPDGVTGPEMMMQLQKQAERFEADIRDGWVTKVDFSGDLHKVWVNDTKEIHCDTVIISTGASAKYLGLESEQKYLSLGGGVSACAVCDGFFYRNQEVVIVGAGDSACEEAHYLSHLCSKVTMLVRRDEFRASKIMAERVMKTENIEILFNTETEEVLGDGQVVSGVRVFNNKTNEKFEIPATGFFVAIGHKPNTDIFKDYLDLDETGYIINAVPGTSKTNVEGVFVSGDAADNVYRQAITAAGTGCMAALDAERYLAGKDVSFEVSTSSYN